MPVWSAVILLRPSADDPQLTGSLECTAPLGPAWNFGYDVIRVWERPIEDYLTGINSTNSAGPFGRDARTITGRRAGNERADSSVRTVVCGEVVDGNVFIDGITVSRIVNR